MSDPANDAPKDDSADTTSDAGTVVEIEEDELTSPIDGQVSNAAANAAPVEPPLDLRAQLAAVEKDKKETYDRLLRTAADFDNFRKRVRKDVDDARTKAREDVLRDILPAVDNLERALVAAQDPSATANHIVDGVRLVLRQFETALERNDVRPFVAAGLPFDPSRHEAVSQLETDAHPPGTVAAEMQRGYTIGTRLLRPALVMVAKAKATPAPPAPAETADSND